MNHHKRFLQSVLSALSSIRAMYCIASRDPSTSAPAPAHSAANDSAVSSPKNKSFTVRISASSRWICARPEGDSLRRAPRRSDGLGCFLRRRTSKSFPVSAVTNELETCIACATEPTLTPATPGHTHQKVVLRAGDIKSPPEVISGQFDSPCHSQQIADTPPKLPVRSLPLTSAALGLQAPGILWSKDVKKIGVQGKLAHFRTVAGIVKDSQRQQLRGERDRASRTGRGAWSTTR